MSDAEDQAQGEPTMEEILASIRRIISEDTPEEEEGGEEAAEAEPEAAAPEPEEEPAAEEPPVEEPPAEEPPAEEEAEEGDDDDDALELTQMVADDGSVVDLNAEREAARAREQDEEPAAPDEGAPEIDLEEAAPAPDEEASLLADTTRSAATSSLLSLAAVADQQNLANLTEGGNRTLEALVRETLEPHLKTWLDANLPVLVERIVREEIQKMVKRAEYR